MLDDLTVWSTGTGAWGDVSEIPSGEGVVEVSLLQACHSMF